MTAVLAIHVQPRAKVTQVVGLHGSAIKIRLKAPPVDGAANDELVRFVADQLGVPRRAVSIVAGGSSRSKKVSVDGLTLDLAQQRLLAGSPSQSPRKSLR